MTSVTAGSEFAPAPRRRFSVTPAIELLVLAMAIAIAATSYAIIAGHGRSALLTPPLVALLLVANLVPGVAILVLLGRRVARRRAARSGAGSAGLQVRLVALFSILATVPTVLLAVIASLLFQYGAEFWFSGRARAILENSHDLAQASYAQLLSYVDNENVAMATDVNKMLFERRWALDSEQFRNVFGQDVFQRSLSGAVLFSIGKNGERVVEALVKNSDRSPVQDVDAAEIRRIQAGAPSVAGTNAERTHSLVRVPGTNLLLYATREGGAKQMAERMAQAQSVLSDYNTLLRRTHNIQLRFNIALLLISLLVIAIVVFVALTVADRLVRPIGQIVDASHRVATGDLAARVPDPRADDEIGTLARAFNTMTGRLEAQTGALESRRALIEAVMSGVSAGVIALGADGTVSVINRSAAALLDTAEESPVGRPLAALAPELAALIDQGEREAIVEIGSGAEARTLAVKIARAEGGPILTFDDITGQLDDQRRAAWSDVARRIAHEIKNPLTPIQLAAERLKRRYGKLVEEDDTTFARLTDTIVRQVGDLRRMVDEFSSFARIPKPVFRAENIVEVAKQTIFLHEVAHPGLAFTVESALADPVLVCDRRQLGQVLTNIVKNAVEAIEARGEGAPGRVALRLADDAGAVVIEVADNGIGLPAARDRILEPYVTTRARGTGLGLAIVKKIVEEHFGSIAFADAAGGGTQVTMRFDPVALTAMATDGEPAAQLEQSRT